MIPVWYPDSFWNQKCPWPPYASDPHLTVISSCVHMTLSTRKVSSVPSKLKYHVQQIPQQPGWWASAHPSLGYENRLIPLVQAMRINQNCASPCKASGHLQKPYMKHRCTGWSTMAFPSPHSHRQTKLLLFCCRRDCFPTSFSVSFSLTFLFQCAEMKFTANTEDTPFPEAARFFFWIPIKSNTSLHTC